MKFPPLRLSRLLGLATIALAASSFPGHAALVVDWGGDYVSSSTPWQNGGFSNGDPLVLSPGSGYSGTSSTFYGAVSISGTRTRDTLIQQASSTDRIQMKLTDAGAGTGAFLALWKQEDFLGGLNTGNVGFTATDTVTLQLQALSNFSPGRLVLKQGSSYYVSEAVFNSATTFNVNPTALTWYNYDPTNWSATDASSLATIGSQVSLTLDGTISNVTQIGFLFASNDSSGNAARVQNFEVNLSAVPEPGTIALMLAASGLLLIVFRRRAARLS